MGCTELFLNQNIIFVNSGYPITSLALLKNANTFQINNVNRPNCIPTLYTRITIIDTYLFISEAVRGIIFIFDCLIETIGTKFTLSFIVYSEKST